MKRAVLNHFFRADIQESSWNSKKQFGSSVLIYEYKLDEQSAQKLFQLHLFL